MGESMRLWSELPTHEGEAWKVNSAWLADVEPAFELLHDLPNALTKLPGFSTEVERVNVAAMCLKRALDELRAMWLLLNAGYTSAAAAACADLWEHSMLSSCISLSDDVCKQFLEDKPDDLSLGASKLSPLLAKLVGSALPESHAVDKDTLDRWDSSDYAIYKWLCQIKHPTMRALRHTTATSLIKEEVLGIAARPDGSEADKSVKSQLLVTAFGVIREATTLLGVVAVGERPSAEVEAWKEDMGTAHRILVAKFPPETIKLPFTIGDTKAGERSRSLRGTPAAGSS